MLPDLWRMAHRHVRPANGGVAGGGSPRVDEVLEGVTHHGRADAAFHASPAFREGERAMTKDLALVGAPRLSLFAHIAWELCLDGALVRREGEALVSDVRAGIARTLEHAAGESPVETAARLHHAARKGEAVPAGFDARVARILGELQRGSWIEGYGRGEVVAERLEGIRSRLGFAAMDRERRSSLAALLDAAIDRAAREMDPLLAMPV
jgi:hypothetical protein